MADRSSSSEQLKYALEVLRLIPRYGFKTARDIHNELTNAGWNKSFRTAQRTIKDIADQFDIYCDDRSMPFGYRWNKNAKGFSLAGLSLKESLMLRLSEEYLKDILPPKLMKSLDSFFEYSRHRLSDPCEETFTLERQWLKKVKIISERQQLIPPEIDPAIFETVTEALYQNQYLELTYENVQGKQSEVKVMPLGLVQQGVRIYIACRYEHGEDYSLAIHRIKKAKALTSTFNPPDDFDLDEYLSKGRFNYGDGRLVEVNFVVVKDAGIHLAETPLSKDQTISDMDDGLILITASVVDSILLDNFVYGFGGSLRSYEKKFLSGTVGE